MLNYRGLMVSNACAAASDREHAAALGNFHLLSVMYRRQTSDGADSAIRLVHRPWPTAEAAVLRGVTPTIMNDHIRVVA